MKAWHSTGRNRPANEIAGSAEGTHYAKGRNTGMFEAPRLIAPGTWHAIARGEKGSWKW